MHATVDGVRYPIHEVDGRLRFKGNPIVRLLKEKAGRGSLDECITLYERDDCTLRNLIELYVGLGYSLDGFMELSFFEGVKVQVETDDT